MAAIGAIMVATAGCRSGRGAASDNGELYPGHQSTMPSDTAAVLAPGAPLEQRMELLLGSYREWNGLQVPVSVKATGLKMTLKGTLSMARGEYISLSLRFMGMEVASLEVTPDSITMVDKYHNIYVSESLSQLTGRVPLTLDNIQDILLGRCFIAGDRSGDRLTEDMFDLKAAVPPSTAWNASPRRRPAGIPPYSFTATDSEGPGRLESLTVEAGASDVTADYGEYYNLAGPDGGVFYPMKVEVTIPTSRKLMTIALQFNHNKAAWTTGSDPAPARPSLSIPANCRRVTLDSLMKSLAGS